MRPDLSAGDLTLLQSGKYDVHYSLEVANGDGTLVQLYDRIEAISGTLPSPNDPIGTLDVEFLREPNDDGADSLAPLMGASLLNRLDDGSTYSAQLEVGRVVVAKAAITARGAARPGSGFYEFFRGRVRAWRSPEEYGNAGIACVDQGGELNRVKSTAEFTYDSGTAIETAIQQVLNNNGYSSITLNVPVATGSVLGVDYEPGKQRSVWEQVDALARSIGWVVWWRYQADGLADLTLFQPARSKVVSDFTFPVVRRITDLSVDDSEIFNDLFGQYADSTGARQDVGPVSDSTSVTKYGGFKRTGWIIEDNESPVRTEAAMTAVLNAALSDLKDPDAIQSTTVPLFLWGEVSADLYTFSSNTRLYDSDQDFAPFSISFSHRIGSDHESVIQTRGTPTAGAKTWEGRLSGIPGVNTDDPEKEFGVYNVRVTARSDTQVTLGFTWGAKVAAIKLQHAEVSQATWNDNFPAVTAAYQELFTDSATETSFTFDIPNTGYLRYVQFVPILENGKAGILRKLEIPPTMEPPDLIRSISVLVGDTDGSVIARVEVADRTGSIRYAYAVGTDPTWKTDAAVEAGTVATPTLNTVTISLPAATVPHNQMIRLRAAPYTGSDGTGTGGATDHGDIKGAEDLRLKPPVSLEPTTESESSATGTFGVTVRDPGGYATNLYYATKSGTGAWSAWTLEQASPVHNTEYTQTVALIEDHHSFIKFRLDYTLHGDSGFITAESGGFDRGKIPDFQIIPDYKAKERTASATLVGDFDTASYKIAASTSAYPSDATVRAATAINGRTLTPADVGTLISNLTPGQVVYIKAFAYSAVSGGGNESSTFKTAEITIEVVEPILEKTTESESSATGTFGVTVRDPSGLATGLQYRTKSGTGAFSAWTDAVVGAPTNNTEYQQTVALIEDHLSFIEFRLAYSHLGQTRYFPLESAGFDRGKIPNVPPPVLTMTELGAVVAAFTGDFDTVGVKFAVSTSAHPAEATVRAATATDSRQFTTATLDTLDLGETLYISWFGYSGAGGTGNEQTVMGKAQITRSAAFIPKVKESVSWSGETATVTLNVEDTRLRVTAISGWTITQGGAESAITWDTDVGAVGVATALTRGEAVTVADGTDVSVRYEVVYTDENGASKTIGGTIPLSNMQGNSRSIQIAFTDLKPADSTVSWDYIPPSGAYLSPADTVQSDYRGTATLPKGVLMTGGKAQVYRESTATVVFTVARISSTGGRTQIGTHTSTSTGWHTLEFATTETVGNEVYIVEIRLDVVSVHEDARVAWIELTYDRDAYVDTY